MQVMRSPPPHAPTARVSKPPLLYFSLEGTVGQIDTAVTHGGATITEIATSVNMRAVGLMPTGLSGPSVSLHAATQALQHWIERQHDDATDGAPPEEFQK